MQSARTSQKLLLVLFFATVAISAHGQQTSLFTQYMFNGLVINPAYTGSHGNMTTTAAYRSQWTRLKGAPQTQVASFHSPIKFSRSAAGALLQHDQAGVTHQYTLYGTYAYHIPVSKNAKISVGGQGGISYYQANRTDANIVTNGNVPDPTYMTNESRFMPNLGGSFGTPFFIALGLSEWKKRPELLQSWPVFGVVNAFVMATCVLIEYAHQILGLGAFHAHDVAASLVGMAAALIAYTVLQRAGKI